MKRIGLLIGFLALLILVLPSVTAQDAKKKDAAPTEKKAEPKKVDKEKLNYSTSFRTKIVSANGENARDFTIEVQEIDPKKVYDMNVWATQQQAQLTQQLFNAQRQKGVQYQQSMFNYNMSLANFQVNLAQRQGNVYTPRNVEVKAAENAKVRSMFLPVEFDDAGALKKWTKKEIEARKDKTGLPGFPADFDIIKSGQYIDIYMAKQTPVKTKTPAKKKKKTDDDDDPPAAKKYPEYVMIVIVAQPMQK